MKKLRGLGLVFFALIFSGFFAVGQTQYMIRVVAEPVEGGSVNGGGLYLEGATAKVVAQPNPGYRFVNWTEEGVEVSTSPIYEFVVHASRTLVAHFEPVQYVIGLSGSWETHLHLLPSVTPDYTRAQLAYGFGYGSNTWETKTILLFKGSEFMDFQVHFTGKLGFASIGAGMYFDPRVPEYRSAYFSATTRVGDFTGILRVQHSAKWGNPPGPYMLYSWIFSVGKTSLTLRFEDTCTGIEFKDATLTMRGIGLCCGICYDAKFSFTKAGFDYLEFKTTNLPLCCGISLDAEVTFSVDGKTVALTPKWQGLGGACLKVYGDALWANNMIQGVEIYGFRIQCCLGDPCPRCVATKIRSPYLELVTAFQPEKLLWAKFQGDEFEYIKLGFCGPGCCGGGYSLEVTAYFHPTGTLFGISRVLVSAAAPVMENLVVEGTFEANVATSSVAFDVGWEFKF